MQEPNEQSSEKVGGVIACPLRRETNSELSGYESFRLHVSPSQSATMDSLCSAWVESKLPKAQIEAAIELALDVFEDRDAAIAWLNEPHLATNNKPPIAFLGTEEGFLRLKTLLGRIEHGVLA